MNKRPDITSVAQFTFYEFVPVLNIMLREADPAKYEAWGGNACRQTSILLTPFLQHLLPNYKWTVWDGIFIDIVKGHIVKYNHSWIYGEHEEKDNLFVDASRVHQERLFFYTNENKYPNDHPEYEHTTLLQKERLDLLDNLRVEEYYTGKKGIQLLHELEEKVNQTFSL